MRFLSSVRIICIVGVCGGLLVLSGCGSRNAPPATSPNSLYRLFLRFIYHNTVPRLTAADLKQELEAVAPPLLLDVRTPAEFWVSHLVGARFVNADSIATVTLPNLDRNRNVVVYCSVGARSEKLGERLLAVGFRHVRNLDGGLFEWVNEGYSVVNEQGPTENIHPYSTFWGLWLQRGNKVYE